MSTRNVNTREFEDSKVVSHVKDLLNIQTEIADKIAELIMSIQLKQR